MAAVEASTDATVKLPNHTGIDISQPRIKRRVGDGNINRNINALLAKWQADFAAYTESGKKDAAKIADFTRRIEALNSERKHVAKPSSRILAIVCNEMVRQLLTHAMDSLTNGRGLMKVSHFYTDGYESLGTYPLFRTLSTWAKGEEAAKVAACTKEYRAEIARLNKELARAFKKIGKDVPAKEEAADAAIDDADEVVDAADDDADDDASGNVNFRTYVDHLYERIKQDEKYKDVRCAIVVRQHLSDMIVEFLDRVSPMFYIMMDARRIHTVNDNIVMAVLHMLLTDGQTVKESFDFLETKVDHPDDRKMTKADGERRQIAGYMMTRNYGFVDDRFAPINALITEKMALFEDFDANHKRPKAVPGATKPAVKAPAAKPAVKAAAKPAAGKQEDKPAAKTPAKAPAKTAPKPADKAAAKAAAKTAGKAPVKPKNGAKARASS